jgi:hypothetical protein
MMPVPDYSLRQLSYLVAVSDAGSMTAAAQHCYVTQAAISAAIRDLERIFGIALVARRPGRGASLAGSRRQSPGTGLSLPGRAAVGGTGGTASWPTLSAGSPG